MKSMPRLGRVLRRLSTLPRRMRCGIPSINIQYLGMSLRILSLCNWLFSHFFILFSQSLCLSVCPSLFFFIPSSILPFFLSSFVSFEQVNWVSHHCVSLPRMAFALFIPSLTDSINQSLSHSHTQIVYSCRLQKQPMSWSVDQFANAHGGTQCFGDETRRRRRLHYAGAPTSTRDGVRRFASSTASSAAPSSPTPGR